MSNVNKKNEISKLNMLKKDIVGTVENKLDILRSEGKLHVPEDYSPSNALTSAWLNLQGITAKVGNEYLPALEVCSKDTIANTLLDMVTQGLTPSKKQCYFIAYNKSLNLQRSYFGDLAVMKRLNDVKSVNANVVYDKDTFEININEDGSKSITHKTNFESLGTDIKGVYCVINFTDGTRHIEVMSIEQVHQSWKQSKSFVFEKNGKIKPDSVHGKFPEEMAKRTIIRKASKMYINTSNDSDLLIEAFNRTSESEYKNVESVVNNEVESNQASETLEPEIENIPETKREDTPESFQPEQEINADNYDEVPY